MPRYTIVYTPDGQSFLKGSPEHIAYLGARENNAPLVFSDEGEFVSPIDGKVYSGKRGMHEHNRRHDVINNRDLVGLQVGFKGRTEGLSASERQQLRRDIEASARRKGYLEGQ